ncbi:MAG: hypothetical protein Q9178_004759 [Gyalolechia marmorata]
MWNRILGKSTEIERKSSRSESQRKSESQRSTRRRSDSLKSTTSSGQTPRTEKRDRGFNPISTSYSSTTQNQYPGTASASIASSYATAFNDPTNEAYPPPGLVRNASLANHIPSTPAGDGQRAVALDSSSRSERDKADPAIMEERRVRKQRRGTRDRDEDKRESKSNHEKKRTNSEKGKERAMSTDEVPYVTSQRGDRPPITSDGVSGSSSFVPHAAQHDGPGRPHAQSSHIQDQFPGQFPAQSAAPYRPPLAASEGGPGLAAEYYGDAGQSVVEQPGVRIHSPSLIVGAEPHLQAASAVAAPPPEPSASGAIGAAASFFDGTFSAGSDMEGQTNQKPASMNVASTLQYSSAAPSVSTYTTSGTRPTSQQSTSAPVIPTLGAAAAGAAAGYHMGSRPPKPAQPGQEGSSTPGFGNVLGSSSHHQHSETHDSYTAQPSSIRPQAKPGKHSSQSSSTPLYAAGAAGVAGAAYHHNQHGSTNHYSYGQHHGGSSMAQQHHHHPHHGPFSKLVDFFKDPEGVAQFEEYTEYIGVCRHCFDPHSSPRDAPRKHHYRRRRSREGFGSSVRVDKDHRYSSSGSESRRRKRNKSWLGAGIAGYGLGKMGESLFLQDNDSRDSHGARHGQAKTSHRRSSSSSSERKSRTSYGVVNRSSNTLSRRSRSKDRVESGVTNDGKLYRKDSQGNIDTLTVKAHNLPRRSRSRSRNRRSHASDIALSAALGSSAITSHSRRRSKSPKKTFVRSKHGADKGSSSQLAATLKLNESAPPDDRRRSRHSPDSKHRNSRRKEKKSRGFFSFSNGSSSSSAASELAFAAGNDRRSGRSTKAKKKDRETRDAEAALLGLGAAALAFNQAQRPRRKAELIAVKESQVKLKEEKHRHKGKGSTSRSEEDPWESASEGEHSSADSELAYGGSLHRRSQESLSSDSSGHDKWGWRWGNKKQNQKASRERRHSPIFDGVKPVAATAAMMTGASQLPPSHQDHDSRMASTSDIPLQYVHPMPTSDPTQFDVARHDPRAPPFQPFGNARPDPVPIQHPQPVAPVSSAVYTSQAPFTHTYSAPIEPLSQRPLPHASALNQNEDFEKARNDFPGAFPSDNQYAESFMKESKSNPKTRRRDSSPVIHTSEYTSSSTGPRRRRSLKDDAASVRFDLTKEQEDKDRRDERRRRKEDEKRHERVERREFEDVQAQRDIATAESVAISSRKPRDDTAGIKRESWAAPAAAGVIATAIGATIAAESSGKDKFEKDKRRDREERDIDVVVKERPASTQERTSNERQGRTSQKTGMSVWQAAAKAKRSSSHTEYAAYFTPPELLSKEPSVKETIGANADNDVTVSQVPNMITIQPSEPHGHSLSRTYSFPITAEDVEHSVKPLPWAVPMLNLVEPTPPSSRAGSEVGNRSPRARSPLSNEFPDIPLEPLESVVTPDPSTAQPEYKVIVPRGHSTDLADSPVNDTNIPETIPGISSLKKKQKPRRKSPPETDYGDDIDFTATVAAGLQDTGFNPSIVIHDPSFRRRESPPGSGDDEYHRGPTTTTVTEVTNEISTPRLPPHGLVEEIPEPHIPGSFEDAEEQAELSNHRQKEIEDTRESSRRSGSPEEFTGPADNADRKPNVCSTEIDAFRPEDVTNVAVDPVGDRPDKYQEIAEQEAMAYVGTEPSENARVKPHVFTAEPEPLEPEYIRNVATDPRPGNQQSAPTLDETAPSQSPNKAATNGDVDAAEHLSDYAPSLAASAPLPSSSRKDSKSGKKSKRRSVGFDDSPSVLSSPATYAVMPEPTSPSKQGRKGGLFGLFSKSTDNSTEPKGIQQTPVEASLEDFEEPKERKKKSKSRKSGCDDEETSAVTTGSVVSSKPEAQDDWDTPKKSKRGKEKRRSSGDPGRITQDLPAQAIPPASPGHDPSPTSNEMLTNLEDHEPDRSRKELQSSVALDKPGEPLLSHDNQQPSFLGERPEKPPLPDIPDASEDPGGQIDLRPAAPSEHDRSESAATKTERPNRSDLGILSDGRSVSYSSPSPTAIPLRPLRFGRRPSSPGLAKSLPSTPQHSTAADLPVTPRRRERPHSTEFKSNEFRPMWLLEKYGSRQEPTPQETYPSLPSSHSTSRASSVHESDDLYRTEALDLALDEANYRRLMQQEPHGLSIDTSHREIDPELLDSQQATPTAASFQSVLKEGNVHSQEPTIEPPCESQESKLELIDAIPPASAYVDPLDEPPQDQRLLHGVKDSSPQRRASSPSQHDAIKEMGASEQSIARMPPPAPLEQQGNVGPGSTLKNAALESSVRGSAATMLKSASQHDEQLEQISSHSGSEQISKAEEELAPKRADRLPDRPTAEETRLMQEQDAQDAVDSWFAPAQSKKLKLDKKGRKRGKSYEEAQAISLTKPSGQLDEHQAVSVGRNQSSPTLGDTAMTAEFGEATTLDTLRDEPSSAPADLNYQTALTSRKDSKGKKKKNKKKTSDSWEETPTGSNGLILERQLDTEPTVGPYPILTDPPTTWPSFTDSVTVNESSTLLAETADSQTTEALYTTPEAEFSSAPAKENRKGKKKGRLPSLVDNAQDQTQGGEASATSEPAEAMKHKDLEISAGPPDAPAVFSPRVSEPTESVSAEVPYEFPSPGEPKIEDPADTLQPSEQPVVKEVLTTFEQAVTPADGPLDSSIESRNSEASSTSTAKTLAPEAILPATQEIEHRNLETQFSPEAIPLPLGDDLDLLPALPESPVLQPMDASSQVSEEELRTKQDPSVAAPTESDFIHGPRAEASDTEPNVLNKVISELALPENATAAQKAEDGEANNFTLASSKKNKSDKKSKKFKGFRAPAFEIGSSAGEPLAAESTSGLDSAEDFQVAVPSSAIEAVQSLSPTRLSEAEVAKRDLEAPSEQPIDDGPDVVTKKGKKGKKSRKGKSTEVDTEIGDLGLLVPDLTLNSSQPVEDSSVRVELPTASSLSADIPLDGQQGADLTGPAAMSLELSKEEPITPAIDEYEEWPTTMKKNKGKKSRRVQFDDLGEGQREGSGAATNTEVPLVTTSTASEIQVSLRGLDSGVFDKLSEEKPLESSESFAFTPSEEPHALPNEQSAQTMTPLESAPKDNDTQVPEESSPTSFAQKSLSEPIKIEQLASDERALADGQDLRASMETMATTGTAAEVQALLSQTEEPEGIATISESTNVKPELATGVDALAWASSDRKKRAVSSKLSEDDASADNQKIEVLQSQESVEPETALLEEISIRKSKKDKNKRKGPSRTASEFGKENPSQDILSTIEEPQRKAEMAIKGKAPSLLQKTDQLPSLEMSTSTEVEQDTLSLVGPSQQETIIAVGEANTPEIARNADVQPTVDVQASLPAVELSSQLPKLEELEISSDAPSILGKYEELPSIEQSLSPESGAPSVDRNNSDLGTTADQALDVNELLLHDAPIPITDIGDVTPAVEQTATSAGPNDVLIAHGVPSAQLSNPGFEDKTQGGGIVADETAQPVLDPSVEIPATKTKEEKKSSEKALALTWNDDAPVTLEEPSIAVLNDQIAIADATREQPSDPLPDNDTGGSAGIPSKSKKMSKKAKGSAWDDDVPEVSAGTVVSDAEQPARYILEDSVVDMEQLSKLNDVKTAQVSARADNVTEASTGAVQPPQGLTEAEIEQPSEAVIEDNPVLAEEPTKSTKDKKSKKSEAPTWDVYEPSFEQVAETRQLDSVPGQLGSVKELSAKPTEQLAEILDEEPIPKKSKKKGKKSKAMAWDEDEPTAPTVDEPRQQTDAPTETGVSEDQPEAIAKPPAEEILNDANDQSALKSKKKVKRSKFVGFDEDSSILPSRDGEDQLEPKSLENEAEPEATRDVVPSNPSEEVNVVPDGQQNPKKGKKKGKKSRLVDFEEEPSVSSPRDKTSDQDPIPTEAAVVAEGLEGVLEPNKTEMAYARPDSEQLSSKKGKKKSKKSKLVDWDEEPSLPPSTEKVDQQPSLPPSTEKVDQQRPILIEPAAGTELPGEVHRSLEVQEAFVPQIDSSIANEIKRKGKKSDHVAWDGEPFDPSAEIESRAELSNPASEVDKNIAKSPYEGDDVSQDDGKFVAALPMSKKNKKAMRATALSSDEQPSPVIQEPHVLDSNNLSRDLEESASEPRIAININEPLPADELGQRGAATTQTEDVQIEVPALLQAVNGPDMLRDAPLDSTESAKAEEHRMPTSGQETPPDASYDDPERPLSGPSTDATMAGADPMQQVAEDQAHPNPLADVRHEAPPVEEILSSDQPVQQASPLLLQIDDVQIGSEFAPPTIDALKVSEANIPPIPPTETLIDRSTQLEDPMKYPEDQAPTSTVPDNLDSAEKLVSSLSVELIGNEPDASVAVSNALGESSPAPEAEAVDAVADLAPVTKKDKKKARKAKEVVAWDEEVIAPVADGNQEVDEGIREVTGQPLVLSTTISEQAPEDPLSISKKDKKKSKKKSKAFSFEDEPSESTTPIELKSQIEFADQMTEELPLPTQPNIAKLADGSQPLSKKEKKKGKKGKKTLDLDDEPSQGTTPAETDLEGDIIDQNAEQPPLPAEPTIAEEVHGVQASSKKDKKKGKKDRKTFDLGDEPSQSTTPAEFDLEGGSMDQQAEQPASVVEPSIADGFGSALLSKKERKKNTKKSKKAFNFDEDPSEKIALAEPLLDETVAGRLEKPSLPAEPSVATANDKSLNPNKPDIIEKNKEAFNFDGEPSQGTTPAEPEDAARDVSIDEPPMPMEANIDAAPVEFSAWSKNGKSLEENESNSTFNHDPSEIITPAEPGSLEQDVLINEPPLPVKTSAAEAFVEFSEPGTKAKKSKKNKQAPTFDDELSLSTTPVEVLDQPAEDLRLPAEPSAAEFVNEFESLSKKDRKKAKKGKKAWTVDEDPSESTTPAQSAERAEPSLADIPDDFTSLSKKDKKKAKKAKKTFAGEDEAPEEVLIIETAAPSDEIPHEVSSIILPASQVEPTEEAELYRPEGTLPGLLAESNDTAVRSEELQKEEGSFLTAGPESIGPVDIASHGPEIVPEADQPDLSATSKKSKKDKKKAKKNQPFNWDNDDATANSPLPGTVTSAMGGPLPGTQEGQPLGPVSEEMITAAASVPKEEPEQIPIPEPIATSPFVEQELAPRHLDPKLILPTDTDVPLQVPLSAPQEKPFEQQRSVDIGSTAEDLTPQPSGAAPELNAGTAGYSTQETGVNDEEAFTPFAPTKKPKKSKKGKKQSIDWEDDTTPPQGTVQETSKAVNDIDAALRPEMMAWPTEVRLNQSTTAALPEEQPTSTIEIADHPALVNDQLPIDEPEEPPPVQDDRSDYFGPSPSGNIPSEPQPFEEDTLHAHSSPAPQPVMELNHSRPENSAAQDDTPRIASQEQIDLPAAVMEQPHAQDNVVAPLNEFEGLAPTKKDKKSKRKKQQALDDVMWEFPPVPPPKAEEMTPIESKWPSDPSRGERLHREQLTAVLTKEEQGVTSRENGQELTRDVLAEEPASIPLNTQRQVDIQAIPEEPQVDEAADDDWGAISKKPKKSKKSRKGKATEYSEEPEFDAQQVAPNVDQARGQSRTDRRSASPDTGAGGAVATAAALGTGIAVAHGLLRKESKKDKNKKGRQASSNWVEPEEEFKAGNEAMIDDGGSKVESGAPTPERHSPIQAWHQNISPSESGKHSELYEVEKARPRSAASSRGRRGYEEEPRQSLTPERRSPIEAWHQYDSPRNSPQQSELYDYDRKGARSPEGQPLPSAINRDSAVHVSDSPVLSQHSPVRRAMRDSGYPDTEASPIVGYGVEHQQYLQGTPRDIGLDHGNESNRANPLQILSEGAAEAQYQKDTRSRSPSRGENDDEDLSLPPRHARPSSFEDMREPSPVSSTTKDRSSVLFQSSPSTREEKGHGEEQRQARSHGSPHFHEHSHGQGGETAHAIERSLTPPREDNSAMVNARAESLAALSGMGRPSQEPQRTSLFGGPMDMSREGSPETPADHDGVNRRRLNTITEYSPEESPLHKKARELSDVGVSAHGVKAARRSGTPLAISKRRARSPLTESGMDSTPAEGGGSRPFWPSIDEEEQPMDNERSRSRGSDPRPSSHQSNISSLVSGPPKQREYERRSFSGASNHSIESITAIIRTPPDQVRSASGMSNRSSGTPPLRRVDRSVSSDLRRANRKSEANKRAKQPEAESEVNTSVPVPVPPTTPNNDSTKDKDSKSRVKQMANVFEGYGDFHGSPLSPTRPPSVRRRQSMQVLELESRNDRLTAENRQLHEAKLRAERDLEDAAHDRNQEIESYREGIETRETWLRQKDTELSQLQETIESLQGQVAQLNEVNEGLRASSRALEDHQERYGQLQQEHAEIHELWQQSTRELEDLRQQHAQLSAGMESIVRHEVTTALEAKNLQLNRLQSDLSSAQTQIRTLQAQILASKHNSPSSDSLLSRDEDYFDALCQSLCSHVQQWVLRFSKFSDSRACYLASEISDEKIVDRMENAILDGSDVDTYLADRVKRRDVFMSMVMTMTWEYIFTRYLFGADREQRQKLKSLEKTLADSPHNNSKQAIHKWRATTLHLLSKRDAFKAQRERDTEAVMQTIFATLATVLPPPSHLVPQIQTSLMKVLGLAVDLSIEMRTQRYEYVMLPPLQPEYDTNGDLARKVYFNAALMNERGPLGSEVGNEELERREAVVRMVLFPLVVRKGEEGAAEGGGVEEIVVCPAQVLCAEMGGRVRVMSAQGSVQGSVQGDVGMGNMF